MVEFSCKRLLSAHFIAMVLFIILNYYLFVVEYMILLSPTYKLAGIVTFHFLFFMTLWSMFMSVYS